MRTAIRKEVASIQPMDHIETACQREVLEWIDSGVEICRQAKPATPPQHLISYFAVIDGEYILLVDHINAELWLPSGGHVEPGEHPRTTVAREAREELSLDIPAYDEPPVFLTITETVGKTAGHTDVSLWYLIQGDRRVDLPFDQNEFHSIRWFHFDDVPMTRTDQHMARFLGKLPTRHDK